MSEQAFDLEAFVAATDEQRLAIMRETSPHAFNAAIADPQTTPSLRRRAIEAGMAALAPLIPHGGA
jgi:hypothetical protein